MYFLPGKTVYAVVAGGYSVDTGSLDSVEILDLSRNDSAWMKGPKLPWPLAEFPLIGHGSGSLLATGGISSE